MIALLLLLIDVLLLVLLMYAEAQERAGNR
jgi:hypothetical protein